MSRFILPLGLLLLLLVLGTTGYVVLENWSMLEGLYMTIITVTTVGFKEVRDLSSAGRVLTLGIIVCGVVVLALFVQQVNRLAIEWEFRNLLWRQKVDKTVKSLKDHVVLCGYGKVGREVLRECAAAKVPVVVVEKEEALIREMEGGGIPAVMGDATDEEVLRKAGVERARGVITSLDNDADNVYVCLNARALRPGLSIVARAADDRAVRNLQQAGATRVISPSAIGGTQMAHALLRPAVLDFMHLTTSGGTLDLQMDQLHLRAGAPMLGTTLRDSNLRSRYRVVVVAILKGDGRTLYNPEPDERLEEGDTLIVLAPPASLNELAEILA